MSKLKFRSGLESAIHEKLNDTFLYEPYRLPYTIHRKYVPDFVHEEKAILIEDPTLPRRYARVAS